MNNVENKLLTSSQFTFTLLSAIVATAILSLPNELIPISKQDAWISSIIGELYPLYIFFVANFVFKKFPNDDIFVLSKKLFGKFFGTILSIIFTGFFIFESTLILSGFTNAFTVYATNFLKDIQVFLSTLIVIAYVSYKGIKTLGKLNELIFYITFFLFLIPAGTLLYGSFLNLKPVFGSGVKNIIISSKESLGAYSGMEVVFLFYPFLQRKDKFVRCGITSTIIAMSIYTWFTFLTIYYLGIETSPKFLWPVLTLSDSINVPIINSFRYFFISLWALIILKSLATYYFAASYSLGQLVKKVPSKTFALLLYPIVIYISKLQGNPITRAGQRTKIFPFFLIFNLVYVSAVAILIYIKKGDLSEKK